MSSKRPPRAAPPLSGGLWISLTVAAVGMVLAGLLGVPQKGGGGPGGKGPESSARVPRALFVWDGSLLTSAEGRSGLIDLALERGIGRLFVEASSVGYSLSGGVEDHTALVDEAHAAGLLVVAAGGFPWWGVSDSAGLPNQPTGHREGWAFYRAIAESGVPYDGVLDDTEPYLAAPEDWRARTPERAQDYLDFLHGVRARIGGMTLFATIPFWYDQDPACELALDGSAVPATLDTHVAAIADGLVVMAYRDFARGTDGILEHALGEVSRGPTIIAVETSYLGDDPVSDKLSFWQEGQGVMEDELALLLRDLRGEPGLVGIAIQDETAYRLLGP